MTMAGDVTSRVLDFSQPPEVYVPLLDNVVDTFFSAQSGADAGQSRQAIEALQKHPNAWEKVDVILQHSKSQQAKFVALQILENTIKTRWNVLPDEQRAGIRSFLTNVIISVATDADTFTKQKVYLQKLNVVLVQVLKKDWPRRWPTFISELVGASKTSENLCENSMHILRLLSEEVFDFNRGELTQAKTRMLKAELNKEFQTIHELCHFVLSSTDLWTSKPSLVKATLSALQVYLTWMPLVYIFNTNLLDILLSLFPLPPFRNLALQCLTEVAALSDELGDELRAKFCILFQIFMSKLLQVLPPDVDIQAAYERGTEDDEQFVQNLALFLTTFLWKHLTLIESEADLRAALTTAMLYLVKISYVDDSEVFKMCLDFWNRFVQDIYSTVLHQRPMASAESRIASLGSSAVHQQLAQSAMGSERVYMYDEILKALRLLMIERMYRPEEVLVSSDQHGNIVRNFVRDTDSQAIYKTMRETLVYLSHLDVSNTEEQMLEKLNKQLNGSEWHWDRLSTLCWAVGSISGSMSEQQENQFLVTVIRDLLNLCEKTRGKDNKAVIASNIMYVVGQYPRFLRMHWKFLKTVVNKLFEFMHEPHPGVQDMAVETLLKICHKCKRKFVVQQQVESQPFVCELLDNLQSIIRDLKVHQIHIFLESVGLMIKAELDENKRSVYLDRLMSLLNDTWNKTLESCAANPDALRSPEVQGTLHNLLCSNKSVCTSVGGSFMPQMVRLYPGMLSIYTKYSELINKGIQEAGPLGAQHSAVKGMRSIKKGVLELIETFMETTEGSEALAVISRDFVPAMMDPVLSDYEASFPDAREPQVLSLFAIIINKLRGAMAPHVGAIFARTFECTLQMITANFADFPEHRLQFFSLLLAITNNCFHCLRAMSAEQQRLVMNSIVWAFRHTERNVADTGLNLLADLLQKFVEANDLMVPFFQAYYTSLLRDVLAVMTDTMHKPGFRLQAKIIQMLLHIAKDNVVPARLWPEEETHSSNYEFVRGYLATTLASSFPNMTDVQVQHIVGKLFDDVDDFQKFKNHLRDFLVQTKEFGSQNNEELFAEERAAAAAANAAAVPGLAGPHADSNGKDDGMDD